MARITRPARAEEEVTPHEGRVFTRADAQHHVEGLAEAIPLEDGTVLIANSERDIIGFDLNEAATVAAGRAIHGPALICSAEEVGPDVAVARR